MPATRGVCPRRTPQCPLAGYSYGCATADVWHTVHHTAMLYPGYEVAGEAGLHGVTGWGGRGAA